MNANLKRAKAIEHKNKKKLLEINPGGDSKVDTTYAMELINKLF